MKVTKIVNSQQIQQAVKILQQGGIIAYPTEAVYGLGCDPKNIAAIKKILTLKKREKEKGLILTGSSLQQFQPFIQKLDNSIKQKLLDSWQNSDHAITWLVPAKESTSIYIKGQFNTIAIRVSHHPVVKELCEHFEGAIISTSANEAGKDAARTQQQVLDAFGSKVNLVVEGETNLAANPSEIRDAISDKIIRSSN